MASHVVVIATDLRRTTVKVNPGTYLTDVLQEACRKLNIDGDSYLIKYKQKQVDLSVPFRTSGLIPGAKLELVLKSKTPSAIQVGLQVPQPDAKEIPGGRLIHKFPSDLSVWQVLRQFESGIASNGRNINITGRGIARTDGEDGGSGQLYYETPVLNIMGRELASFADFQKTLSQLGYNSGSVLIRLAFRGTDQTLHEAMEQISQFFQEEERPREGNTAPPTDEKPQLSPPSTAPSADTATQPTTVATEAPSQDQPASTTEEVQNDGMQIDSTNTQTPSDPYKPVNVFLAPSGTTPAATLAPPTDTDFTPTAAHAQLHQARLLQNSRNKRLPSDRELEERAAAEAARLAAITSVLVKVRFPDNTSSDWQVGPSETGAFLYEAVRHVMAPDASLPFRLVLPGEKTVIKDDAGPKHTLIKAYKLSGRVLVSLVWDDSVPLDVRKGPFLKSTVAQRGQAVQVPELPKEVEEKQDADPAPSEPAKRSGGEGDGGQKKIPKWLKLGKK